MTREELESLTINDLNQMTEKELDIVANEIVNNFADYEIEKMPNDVKEKLQLKRESFWGGSQTWITLIIGALVASIVGAMLGN